MKTPLHTLALLLAGAAVANAQHGHMAGGPPGKLTVAVGSSTASPGQVVQIPITLSGANGLGALELVLTYDPAVLEAKSAERGSLLGSNSLVEHYSDASGRLAVTLVSQDGVGSDGPVIVAHLLVKGQAGHKSALRLENVRAWDGKSHLDFLVTTTGGEFTVGSGWPWWWIAVAIIAVLLLLVLLSKATRRTRPTTSAAANREPVAEFRCPKCGQPYNRGATFCSNCGQKLTSG